MKFRPPTFWSSRAPKPEEDDLREFEDQGELGRGGMGSVRRIWDPRLLRHTAMKSVDPTEAHPRVIPRFVEEAQITGQLEHPHIVPVHEFGVDTTGKMYLSMKLVEGETLWRRVHRQGDHRLEARALGELVGVLVRVCDAMAYAHSRGVVHRDLKPSNIMVGAFGQVYVVDWGIAMARERSDKGVKVSRDPDSPLDSSDRLVGTPSWMAPEQARAEHERVGPASDTFAVGAMLYFILTGVAPYGTQGPVLPIIRKAQVGRFSAPSKLVPPHQLPSQLERICLRAMQTEPEDRYGSIAELGDELRGFLQGTWNLPLREIQAGQVVVREGEPGSEAYVVRSGSFEVLRDVAGQVVPIRTLEPGDCFGEMAILSDGMRTATVRAVTDGSLNVVTRQALEEGLGLNQWMGSFVKALAHRFTEAEQRLESGSS